MKLLKSDRAEQEVETIEALFSNTRDQGVLQNGVIIWQPDAEDVKHGFS